MAVTSIWPIKGKVENVIRYAANPEKTTEKNANTVSSLHAVDNVIEYAADELKTEKLMYVSGVNCTIQNAARKFNADLARFGRRSDRVCYHAYQSFAENEVDAKTANEIGIKLAERLWGDKFRVVVATHCNTGHYHNHFVICATSFVDGSRFDNNRRDYLRMREESDKLCREYGLSVIKNPREHGKDYGEWLAEKSGQPTLRSVIREAVDVAIRGSVNQRQFISAMDEMGFIIDQSGKHPKIKQVGNDRFVRFDSLGPGYSVDEIVVRINRNSRIVYPKIPPQESPQQIFEEEPEDISRMGYISINRCYFSALSITKERPDTNRRMYFLIRQDHSAMRIYQDQLNLVTEHHLDSEQAVRNYKAEAMKKIDEYTAIRKDLRNDLRRAERLTGKDREAIVSKVRLSIEQCTAQLAKLRREVTSCDEVIERIDRMRDNLIRIKEEKFRGKEQIGQIKEFIPEKARKEQTRVTNIQKREEMKK